jgi:hypothetical protein
MATLQQKIAAAFLTKLREGEDVDAGKIDQLRTLLGSGKKPKADDLVKIFTAPEGSDAR